MKCDVCDVEGVEKIKYFKENNVHLCLRCSHQDRDWIVSRMIQKIARSKKPTSYTDQGTVLVSEQKKRFMSYLESK